MSYIITGTDSAGALCLKRDSAAAAIKKASNLWEMGAETSASPTQMAASTNMRISTNCVRLRGRKPRGSLGCRSRGPDWARLAGC
jgi:hypothetical protein